MARDVRRILAPGRQFLIWEPTSLSGEDRKGWADRVAERGRAFWPEFDDEERETVVAHCRASDYPETADWWLSLRQVGGFSDARDLLEAPPGLGRVYAFTASAEEARSWPSTCGGKRGDDGCERRGLLPEGPRE